MGPKVFLSLSFVDDSFVEKVYSRLPTGIAFFYKRSFENSASLISEMEKGVDQSKIFVLFASPQAIGSLGVQFELDNAHRKIIRDPSYRILIYPTSSKISHADLPEWLRPYWVPNAGYGPFDVARHITQLIIGEYRQDIFGTDQIIGRGKAVDELSAVFAEHVARHSQSPRAIILSGFRGIGRKTFAKYYSRVALSFIGNAPYGPTIALTDQADISDLYLSVVAEISDNTSQSDFAREFSAFVEMSVEEQATELAFKLKHFSDLSQVPIVASASGFLEDSGDPKEWVIPLMEALDSETIVFLITGRMFPYEQLVGMDCAVQYRVPELSDSDIKTLMVLTAQYLSISDYTVGSNIVSAIGGHPDIARQAVLLAKVYGNDIFERDPKKIFDIQNSILSDSISDEYLEQRDINLLSLLSWVPSLPNQIVIKVMEEIGESEEEFAESLENLILACLIIPSGSQLSISPAIRLLFRRMYPSSDELISAFSSVLKEDWDSAQEKGEFRVDLFEAFVYMHSLEGSALPVELRNLVTPGMLHEVVRQNYNLGKDRFDTEILKKAISWGEMTDGMRMSDATREEILSIVARAQIRIHDYEGADATIDKMKSRGYRSTAFLKGHSLRRQGKASEAVPLLVEAVREGKALRSAVHELALCYKKEGNFDELRELLAEHANLISDSAFFLDFQIGLDISAGRFPEAEQKLNLLSRMSDDNGRSGFRSAQLLERRHQHREAKNACTELLKSGEGVPPKIRSLRAVSAANDGDFRLADSDIEFLSSLPAWSQAAERCRVIRQIAAGNLEAAKEILDGIKAKSAEDWLLEARYLEAKARLPATLLIEKNDLQAEAQEIRVRHRFHFDFDFED